MQKLCWYQKAQLEKYLIVAAFVYQIQLKNLDQKYLTEWAKKLEVLDTLQSLSKVDLE